jgi:hypothetical protein
LFNLSYVLKVVDGFSLSQHEKWEMKPQCFVKSIMKGEEIMVGLLWAVVVILVVLWLLGFVVLHVSSFFIHLLLILAVIVLLYNLFVGSRARRP